MNEQELKKLSTDLRYLLDRIEIQDKISLYALGQDHHQSGAENKNVLEEWNEIFSEDVQIDCKDAGLNIFTLKEYAEMMRGPELQGGGMEILFKTWAHLEHATKVDVNGDTADSISLHIHTHETKDGAGNMFAVGYWYDHWERTAMGWRITNRRLKQLYFNTFQVVANSLVPSMDL